MISLDIKGDYCTETMALGSLEGQDMRIGFRQKARIVAQLGLFPKCTDTRAHAHVYITYTLAIRTYACTHMHVMYM